MQLYNPMTQAVITAVARSHRLSHCSVTVCFRTEIYLIEWAIYCSVVLITKHCLCYHVQLHVQRGNVRFPSSIPVIRLCIFLWTAHSGNCPSRKRILFTNNLALIWWSWVCVLMLRRAILCTIFFVHLFSILNLKQRKTMHDIETKWIIRSNYEYTKAKIASFWTDMCALSVDVDDPHFKLISFRQCNVRSNLCHVNVITRVSESNRGYSSLML